MTDPNTPAPVDPIEAAIRALDHMLRRKEARIAELQAQLATARAEERERCAVVADKVAVDWPPAPRGRHDDWGHGWQDGAMAVAADIRVLEDEQ